MRSGVLERANPYREPVRAPGAFLAELLDFPVTITLRNTHVLFILQERITRE